MRRLCSLVLISMAIVGAPVVAGCNTGTSPAPTNTPTPGGTSGDAAADGEPEEPDEPRSGGYSY